MTFEFMRLRIRDLAADGEWREVGAVVRGDDGAGMTFHTRPGFEAPTSKIRQTIEQASIGGSANEAWDYLLDRGFGLYSVFTEPDTLEAASRSAAVESLFR